MCVYACNVVKMCSDVRWRVGGKEELNDNLTFNVLNLFIAYFLSFAQFQRTKYRERSGEGGREYGSV